LVKENLLTTLSELGKEFSISFDFKATEYSSFWENVIRFTEGGLGNNVGDRIPALMVRDPGFVMSQFPVNGQYWYKETTEECPVDQWRQVKFSQTLENDKYMYRVKINGITEQEVVNEQPTKFFNVKVYAAKGSPGPVKGYLKNLVIKTDGNTTARCGGPTLTPGRKKRNSIKPNTTSSRTETNDENNEEHSIANEELPLIDVFLNPDLKEERKELVELKWIQLKKYFSESKITKTYPNLFKLLWYSFLPCSQLFNITNNPIMKKCMWDGKEVDCSSIFEITPTDMGVCCAFNQKSNLKSGNVYTNLVGEMQKSDRDLQKKNNSNEKTTSMKITQSRAGKSQGLSLILDSHSNEVSPGTVANDFNGFQIFIGTPTEFPAMRDRSIVIEPGYEHFVDMSGFSIVSDPDLKSVDPKKRKCLFDDEYALDFYKTYTQINCQFECEIKVASGIVDCIPWYMPQDGKSEVCDPWETLDFIKAFKTNVTAEDCEHCLPDCTTYSYSSTKASAPFRNCDSQNLNLSPFCDLETNTPPFAWENKIRQLYDEGDLPEYVRNIHQGTAIRKRSPSKTLIDDEQPYDAFKKDIAVVNIYFGQPKFSEYSRKVRLNWVDFLSRLGGLLGGNMGFSVMSALELFYWFIIRLGRTVSKDAKKPK